MHLIKPAPSQAPGSRYNSPQAHWGETQLVANVACTLKTEDLPGKSRGGGGSLCGRPVETETERPLGRAGQSGRPILRRLSDGARGTLLTLKGLPRRPLEELHLQASVRNLLL
eukprot:scaffold56557_cov27-Tisochrysis_lutea.AAC.6